SASWSKTRSADCGRNCCVSSHFEYSKSGILISLASSHDLQIAHSAAIGRAACLGGLVDLVVHVQPLEDKLGRAGGCRLAGFPLGKARKRGRGELIGSLSQARYLGDALQDGVGRDQVSQLHGMA